VSLTNYQVLKKDTIPLLHEPAEFYMRSLRFFVQVNEIFGKEGDSGEKFNTLFLDLVGDQKGTTIIFFTYPFYKFLGVSDDSAIMTNTVFLLVLIFSVYGIGAALHSKKAGVLAAIICVLFPIVYAASRTFIPLFALAAMTTLNIFLLIKTQEFTNRKYSILLGISMVLSFFTRPAFSVFIIAPFLVTMLFIIKNYKNENIKIQIINMGLMFLTFFALLSVKFLNFRDTSIYLGLQINTFLISIHTIINQGFYNDITLNTVWLNSTYLLGVFFAVLFFISLLFMFIFKTKKKLFLLSWLFFPIAFLLVHYLSQFGALHYMFIKQIIVVIPAVAIIIALFLIKIGEFDFAKLFYRIVKIKKSRRKKATQIIKRFQIMLSVVIIFLVILVGLVGLIFTSFICKDGLNCPQKKPFAVDIDVDNWVGKFYPRKLQWNPDEILALLGESNDGVRIFLFDRISSSSWILKLKAYEKKLSGDSYNYDFVSCSNTKADGGGEVVIWMSLKDCVELIESCDWVLKDLFFRIDTYLVNPEERKKTYDLWETDIKNEFSLAQTFNDSYSQKVELYKKI